ncbi:MAG: monovalent cation/H+ antiporter complex subunit F [Actinomycetota bacterium]
MIATIATAGFVISGGCAIVRLLVGPALADRVIALDVALISLMGAIATSAVATDDTTYLNLLAVIAIIGFTATVAAGRFIEHENRTGS